MFSEAYDCIVEFQYTYMKFEKKIFVGIRDLFFFCYMLFSYCPSFIIHSEYGLQEHKYVLSNSFILFAVFDAILVQNSFYKPYWYLLWWKKVSSYKFSLTHNWKSHLSIKFVHRSLSSVQQNCFDDHILLVPSLKLSSKYFEIYKYCKHFASFTF